MSLTYDRKQSIIGYLANQSHWHNRFDMDFFTDETRRWKCESHNGLEVKTSPDHTRFILTHALSGARLTIEKKDRCAVISDESGNAIVYDAAKKAPDVSAGGYVAPMKNPHEMGLGGAATVRHAIPELGLFFSFEPSGRKTVFFEDAAKKVRMAAPKTPHVPAGGHPGRFFHEVNFTADTAGSIGMELYALMQAAKLVIARDLCIEPDIRTFNVLDPQKAHLLMQDFMTDKYDPDWQGPEQWRPKLKSKIGDVASIQKAWKDTTEFEGHFVAVPQRFHVEKSKDGYSFRTSLDDREAIWAQAKILFNATSGYAQPVETITSKTDAQAILRMLQKGVSVEDHRGRAWSYIVVSGKETAPVAEKVRGIMRDDFALNGHDYASLNFERGLCLLAMDASELARLSARPPASPMVPKI